MNPLIINYDNAGYELLIPNVDGPAGALAFIGTAEDETAGLRLLAETMQQGVDAIAASSEFIFEAGGEITAEGIAAIFSSGDAIAFAGAEGLLGIYAAEEGETLMASLADAGAELLEFLIAL